MLARTRRTAVKTRVNNNLEKGEMTMKEILKKIEKNIEHIGRIIPSILTPSYYNYYILKLLIKKEDFKIFFENYF